MSPLSTRYATAAAALGALTILLLASNLLTLAALTGTGSALCTGAAALALAHKE